MFLGLRTVIHPAPDLPAAKAFFEGLLGFPPYFDQPFYVGFSVHGYELGLDPAADPDVGPVQDVGEGIRVARVVAPGSGVLGIIENPNFQAG